MLVAVVLCFVVVELPQGLLAFQQAPVQINVFVVEFTKSRSTLLLQKLHINNFLGLKLYIGV